MSQLICLNCGNTEFWEAELEFSKVIHPTVGNLLIEDMILDGDNWSEEIFRKNLLDLVKAVLHGHSSELYRQASTGHYLNRYIACAVCHSYEVTPPFNEWHPPLNTKTISEEIRENRESLIKLKKLRGAYENNLPILWKSKALFDPSLGPHNL